MQKQKIVSIDDLNKAISLINAKNFHPYTVIAYKRYLKAFYESKMSGVEYLNTLTPSVRTVAHAALRCLPSGYLPPKKRREKKFKNKQGSLI